MTGQPSGSIRSVWHGEGRGRGEPSGHRCAKCYGPYGKSNIRCVNEPAEVTAEEQLLRDIFETPEEAS